MNYRAMPDWLRSFMASALYLLALVLLWYAFINFDISVSLTLPVFLAIILSVFGGFVSSIVNACMLTVLSLYLFSGDTERLSQNIIFNPILIIGAGWLATSRRNEARRADVNQAKAKLVDDANGNVRRLWMMADLLQFADDNWGTKTGYDSLLNAKEMAKDLATMVKGWRVLAMEKHLVIKDDEANK